MSKQWDSKWQVKENVFVETDHKDSAYHQPSTENVHNRLIQRVKMCASSFLRLEECLQSDGYVTYFSVWNINKQHNLR